MIRKLMLGAAAAVAIGFGAQTASAHEPVLVQPSFGGPAAGFQPGGGFVPRIDYDYVVYVGHRHRDHIDWEFYGRYETYHEARRVERRLEDRGLRARIEEVRDRRPRW